ncbi:MAG: hypothetical protein IT430_01130 [Phycisphaerales bacterium]|nr:hypothetical protein [Phycisphaerales bacterium]
MNASRGFVSCIAAAGAIAACSLPASAGDLNLEVAGQGPGELTLRWSGAEPNRQMAILYGEDLGLSRSIRVCEGTWIGMSGVRLVRVVSTRSAGSGSVTGSASPDACGGYLQLMVLNNTYVCQTSNVVQISN